MQVITFLRKYKKKQKDFLEVEHKQTRKPQKVLYNYSKKKIYIVSMWLSA